MVHAAMKPFVAATAIFAMLVGTCMAQDSVAVVLGGIGPTRHLQTVLDGIWDTLSSGGVKVKVASGEGKARSVLLEEMKTSGNTILLYVTVTKDGGARGKILVESFVDGKKMWQEESRGSQFAGSAESEVRGMLKSIDEKIKKHIGGPGLPK